MLAYFNQCAQVYYQLSPGELIYQTLSREQGTESSSGALCISTGAFTGRSPQDKFIVSEDLTRDTVNWDPFHQPIEESSFLMLKEEMLHYLANRGEVWVRDAYVCADDRYRINLRVVNEQPSSNLFCYNMFLRPDSRSLSSFQPDWHIVQAPGYKAHPAVHHTRSEHFVVISFSHRTILIGGTAYTGEIKKSVFSILNFILLRQHGVLPMHCSANAGEQGDVALFFGLSGTGKTTLSADLSRSLIGDDEHGWAAHSIFNFEGGCYAKVIDLCKEKEPAIAAAIRKGALVENTTFVSGTNSIDFASKAITENTRASYPLSYIPNAASPSIGGLPRNVIFLTCDAYGVLPPVSRLTIEQAMFHFILGYTAKIAGTETGITEPKATFSACFGAPFLPLHPAVYTKMLGKKLKTTRCNVWLVNTGWTGGGYGEGKRIALKDTRAMVGAILNGELDKVPYTTDEVFGLNIPGACPGVDPLLLNPVMTWKDKEAYLRTARGLNERFTRNFEPYAPFLQKEVSLTLAEEEIH